MEYSNILKNYDILDKKNNISIEINDIHKRFTWHHCKISDMDITDCVFLPLFIETPLLIVNELNNSEYNKQLILDMDISKKNNPDYNSFYKNLEFINKLFESNIKEYLKKKHLDNGIKNNINNQFKVFIDFTKNPLFYDHHMKIISSQIRNINFQKNLVNCKIKCIIKPLLWSKNNNNIIEFGIKYIMCQCILSNKKIMTEYSINKEKILSLKNEEDHECSICKNSIIDIGNNYDNSITKLPCNHKFHFQCIQKWYSFQLSNNRIFTCPYCRAV